MELLIAGMAGVTMCAAIAAFRRRDAVVSRRIGLLSPPGKSDPVGRDSVFHKILARLGSHIPGNRSQVGRALQSAGLEGWSEDAFLGSCMLLGLIGGIGGLQFGGLAVVAAPALAFAGYRVPWAYLAARRRARNEDIARQVPDAAELLAICAQAGLNIPLALVRVAARTRGRLGEELRRATREMDFGVTRREALEGLAARNQVSELTAFVAVLTSADKFGTKVTSSLSVFASDLRSKQRRAAEEQARRAPVKLLFPLVFLILPAFILLTVVPLLLGTFRSLGF